MHPCKFRLNPFTDWEIKKIANKRKLFFITIIMSISFVDISQKQKNQQQGSLFIHLKLIWMFSLPLEVWVSRSLELLVLSLDGRNLDFLSFSAEVLPNFYSKTELEKNGIYLLLFPLDIVDVITLLHFELHGRRYYFEFLG